MFNLQLSSHQPKVFIHEWMESLILLYFVNNNKNWHRNEEQQIATCVEQEQDNSGFTKC